MSYVGSGVVGGNFDFLAGPVTGGMTSPPASISKLPTNPIKESPFVGVRQIGASIEYDSQGRPKRNPYTTMLDVNGELQSKYGISDKIGADINLDQSAYNAMQARALSQAPSAWAQMQQQRNNMLMANDIDTANIQAAGRTNGAWNQLASRGGLSAGQRMRLASQGAQNAMQAQQQIRNQNSINNLNVDLQDQQQKDQWLSQLPSMSLQNANFAQAQRDYRNQATQADLTTARNDLRGYNAYNEGAYKEAASLYGADKTAQAQIQAARAGQPSGGLLGGCFITTAMVDHFGLADDGVELTTLRNFRDTYMKSTEQGKKEVEEYYQLARDIDGKLRSIKDETVWEKIRSFINDAVFAIQAKNNLEAYFIYKNLVNFVKKVTTGE